MKYDEVFVDELSAILLKNKALKNQDISVLKEDFKKRSDIAFEFFLLSEGLVEKEDLLQALQEYYKVPAFDVTGEFFNHELVTMFPKDVLLRYRFIPYEHDNETLVVVAATPDDPELLDIIGRYVSYDVTMMVGYCIDIEEQIEAFYDKAITEESFDQDLRAEHEDERLFEEMTEEKDIRKD